MPKKRQPGSLTGSNKFQKSRSVGDVATDAIKGLADSVKNTVNNGAKTATNAAQTINSFAGTVNNAREEVNSFTGAVSNLVGGGLAGLASPDSVVHGISIPKFDVNGALGSDLFQADSNIAETTIQEAIRRKGKITRQANTLDIGLEKAKLGRKAIALGKEIRLMEGDAIDYYTVGVNNATKVVKARVAEVDYQTEDSKFEQKRELLTHQQIATAGTQTLTPLIRQEWELKREQYEVRNEILQVEIDGTRSTAQIKRIELESLLLEAAEL